MKKIFEKLKFHCSKFKKIKFIKIPKINPVDLARKPAAARTVYTLSFLGSFISILPLDPFLAIITIVKPKNWHKYAFHTTLWSVLGGIFGYLIGLVLFDLFGDFLTSFYDLEEGVKLVGDSFNDNAFMTIFIAAITPIPYQLFTVTAGMFSVNFIIFVSASILGRGIRYYLVAFLMFFVGEEFGKIILKYFNWFLLITGLLILLRLFFF